MKQKINELNNHIVELIDSINELGGFSWNDAISLIALIASWLTIFLLFRERYEQNRPYLQITFELVKSNLACVVLRNVGKTPLVLTNITFDNDFIKQLPEREQKHLTLISGASWGPC